MAERPAPGHRVSITGDVSGQVAVGQDIRQHQVIGAPTLVVTEAELAELRQAFADARARALEQAPPESHDAVAERLDELEEAAGAGKPDVTTMAYVKGWFLRRAPHLAGIITGLLVNPILGKVVEAAGESVAAEFRERVVDTGAADRG